MQQYQTAAPAPAYGAASTQTASQSACGQSNQDLLRGLDLTAPEAMVDAGSDWLDSGLDAFGAGVAEVARENQDAGVGGSFVHLVAAGAAWALHEDEEDAAVRQLMEQEGLAEDQARMWVENLAGVAFGEDPCWEYLVGPLQEWRSRIAVFDKYSKAVEALRQPDAHTRPGDALREFATLYEFATAVVPAPPGIDQFLGVYGTVMRQAADVLDELARTLVERDRNLPGVHQKGSYDGGAAVHGFLRGLRRGTATLDDGITAWLIEHESLLELAAGERLPFPVRTFLGHEFEDRMMVDENALLQWCITHMEVIARLVWGEKKLCEEWTNTPADEC